jgi:hypothetical protein
VCGVKGKGMDPVEKTLNKKQVKGKQVSTFINWLLFFFKLKYLQYFGQVRACSFFNFSSKTQSVVESFSTEECSKHIILSFYDTYVSSHSA